MDLICPASILIEIHHALTPISPESFTTKIWDILTSMMFIGAFGVRLYGYITSSVFSIPAYIGPYFIWAAIGWIITVASSFGLSYLFVVKMDH